MLRLSISKRIFLFFLFAVLISCDSYFEFTPIDDGSVVNPNDDPIVDPFEDDDQEDPESFGLAEGYCYGFTTPSYPLAQIETEITFSESIDLSLYLPPVGSQGIQGSCVAWAAGYYLKSYQENLEDFNKGETTFNNFMSPAFVYNQIKVGTCAEGSSIPIALELISNTGIVSWQEMPYDQNECSAQPTAAQNILAGENKIMTFAPLDGDKLFDQARAFLMNDQPIVIAISIDREFFGKIDAFGDSVYRKIGGKGEIDGAHAMLVVGYNDAKTAFKVVNSWGKNWGNNGFVWIDYKAFKEVMDTESDLKILCEAWVSTDITE